MPCLTRAVEHYSQDFMRISLLVKRARPAVMPAVAITRSPPARPRRPAAALTRSNVSLTPAAGWPGLARPRWLSAAAGLEDSADAYVLLGVDARYPHVTDREVKVAYLRLAKRFHPDLNPGDESATRRFQHLANAYEALKSERARAAYVPPPPPGARAAGSSSYSSAGDARGGGDDGGGVARPAWWTWEEATDDADAMAEAAADWARDEVRALETDVAAASAAVRVRDWAALREFARRRSGLVLSVALPLLVTLRWPAAVGVALRAAPTLLKFGYGLLKVFSPVWAVRALYMSWWALAAASARRRNARKRRSPPSARGGETRASDGGLPLGRERGARQTGRDDGS